MGVIADRMTWDSEKDGLLQYLRLSTLPPEDLGEGEEDPLLSELRLMLAVAVELAEQYVGTNLDYLDDEDGGEESELPESVRLWCYRYVAWRFNRRDDRTSEGSSRGGDSITWGEEPDYSLLAPWRTVRL
ncbi:MAG: hypothetical protein RBS17_01630 [Coriobacteriia bacterium]|jgi:hypothetical protein|nr:hypothetical protein [Coriobacteriia bacterium]